MTPFQHRLCTWTCGAPKTVRTPDTKMLTNFHWTVAGYFAVWICRQKLTNKLIGPLCYSIIISYYCVCYLSAKYKENNYSLSRANLSRPELFLHRPVVYFLYAGNSPARKCRGFPCSSLYSLAYLKVQCDPTPSASLFYGSTCPAVLSHCVTRGLAYLPSKIVLSKVI